LQTLVEQEQEPAPYRRHENVMTFPCG